MVPIAEKTYQKLTKLISDLAGIELASNREMMLVNRISSRLIALKIDSFEDYYDHVSSDLGVYERQALIEVVTTHYTSFFRDAGQFAHAREELARLFQNRQRKVRIWSAACSSGEEAYSLAIVASEAAASAGVRFPDIRILATDISNQILKEAHAGWFPQTSLQKLTVLQRTYFEPTPKPCEVSGLPMLRVNSQIREMMIFRKVNLCEQPLRVPADIDIIFCRNVLLYFNPQMQRRILASVTNKLKSGGLLYVGASEQIRGFLPEMASERACVFRKASIAQTSTFTGELCVAPRN